MTGPGPERRRPRTASTSDVFVWQTTKDLVAGSGLVFEDTDERDLQGVPDRWRLCQLAS